jgi:hypothetical protein
MVFELSIGGTLFNWNINSAAMETGNSLALTQSYFYVPPSTASTVCKTRLRAGASNTQVSDYGASNAQRQFIIEDMGIA